MKRAELFSHHAIKREALSVRQRMGEVLGRLADGGFVEFTALFDASEGRLGVVVTFLSILELAKERLVEIVQDAPLSPIHLRAIAGGLDKDGGANDDEASPTGDADDPGVADATDDNA
jgi:segregation and condensation protein A